MKKTWKLINLIHLDIEKAVNALKEFLMWLLLQIVFFCLSMKSIFPLTFRNLCKWQERDRQREKNFLVLGWDSKKPTPPNVAYMEQEPCKRSAFKMQIHRRLIVSFFFPIASTGIAEVTWKRDPIHTKIGRFSGCNFYSCYCPSLGIGMAAQPK